MVWRDREIGPVYPGIGSAPDAFLRNEPGDDIFGVPPARHDPRADERGGLDVVQPGLGERLDQLDVGPLPALDRKRHGEKITPVGVEVPRGFEVAEPGQR